MRSASAVSAGEWSVVESATRGSVSATEAGREARTARESPTFRSSHLHMVATWWCRVWSVMWLFGTLSVALHVVVSSWRHVPTVIGEQRRGRCAPVLCPRLRIPLAHVSPCGGEGRRLAARDARTHRGGERLCGMGRGARTTVPIEARGL